MMRDSGFARLKIGAFSCLNSDSKTVAWTEGSNGVCRRELGGGDGDGGAAMAKLSVHNCTFFGQGFGNLLMSAPSSHPGNELNLTEGENFEDSSFDSSELDVMGWGAGNVGPEGAGAGEGGMPYRWPDLDEALDGGRASGGAGIFGGRVGSFEKHAEALLDGLDSVCMISTCVVCMSILTVEARDSM